MTVTARQILSRFADAFPQSAHYRGGRALRLGSWEREFPRILTDVEAKNEFLDAVDELTSLGVLRAKWRRFRERDDLEALYLTDPQQLYRLLEIPSPDTVRQEMLAILDRPPWTDSAGSLRDRGHERGLVRDRLRALLEARHPAGVETPDVLRDLGVVFSLASERITGIPLRALSVRLFNDSKRVEALLPVADRISQRISGIRISEELGLARTYPEVTIALRGTLRFVDTSWECAGLPVTLPVSTAQAIIGIQLDAGVADPAALSIENKETFYAAADRLDQLQFACLIYTGGHPNQAVLTVLGHLRDAGVPLSHFGDLDPDGLLIYQELSAALDAPIEPFRMDPQTFAAYRRFGYRLDESRLVRLAPILDPSSTVPEPIRELARDIRATETGVEQEVIALEW